MPNFYPEFYLDVSSLSVNEIAYSGIDKKNTYLATCVDLYNETT